MDRVSESLLAELTGGTLAPGTPLAPEAELAQRLGVSTRTVRAAVDALIGAGYLVRSGASTVRVAAPAACAALS